LPKRNYEEEGNFFQKKMQITEMEYDDDFDDQRSHLSISFPISATVEYGIEIFICSSWTRVNSMTWRMDERWMRRGARKGVKTGTEVHVYIYCIVPPHRARGAYLLWVEMQEYLLADHHLEEIHSLRNDSKTDIHTVPWKAVDVARYTTMIDWQRRSPITTQNNPMTVRLFNQR